LFQPEGQSVLFGFALEEGAVEVADEGRVCGVAPEVFGAVEEEVGHVAKHRFGVLSLRLQGGDLVFPEGDAVVLGGAVEDGAVVVGNEGDGGVVGDDFNAVVLLDEDLAVGGVDDLEGEEVHADLGGDAAEQGVEAVGGGGFQGETGRQCAFRHTPAVGGVVRFGGGWGRAFVAGVQGGAVGLVDGGAAENAAADGQVGQTAPAGVGDVGVGESVGVAEVTVNQGEGGGVAG